MEMAELYWGLTAQASEKIKFWKAEYKKIEKTLGLKKDDKEKQLSGHPHKSGSASGTKSAAKAGKDHKIEKKMEQMIPIARDLTCYQLTFDLIHNVHERHRHNHFQFCPT